jgi:hypothetical protein
MKKPAARTKLVAYPVLLNGIATLVDESRHAVVRAANCFMTATYWEVGRRIVEFEQGGKKRAEYGTELLERLSRDLTERHGRGFGVVNLSHMKKFYLCWPVEKILQTPSEKSSAEILPTASGESAPVYSAALSKSKSPILQTPSAKFTTGDWVEFLRTLAARFPLPWSHYVKLLTVKDENARRFYEEEALRGGWSG